MTEKYIPDYQEPYEILGKCYHALHFPPPPHLDTSEKTIRKCIQYAQQIYFPEVCPKCQKPYPKAKQKKGLYLSKDPDQIHCFNCMVELLEKGIIEVFQEQQKK